MSAANSAASKQMALGSFWGKGKPGLATKAVPKTRVASVEPMAVDEPPKASSTSKRKAAPASDSESSAPETAKKKGVRKKASSKKARVVESDDDTLPASKSASPEPVKKAANKSPKVTPPPVEEDSDSKATTSPAPVEDDGESEVDSGIDEVATTKASASKKCLLFYIALLYADTGRNSAEWAVSKIDEVDKFTWKDSEDVPYAALAHVFSLIEGTKKRIEKASFLTSLFLLVMRRSAPGDTEQLLKIVYLSINRLCPDYEGIELGIGESMLIKAISTSTGRPRAAIKNELKLQGDLGKVAMESKGVQKTIEFLKPKPLTVKHVFNQLLKIAKTTGNKSQDLKTSTIQALLAECRGDEAKYIIRSCEGKLRIGNAERSVLLSLSHAIVLHEQEKSGKKWAQEKLAARLQEAKNVLDQVYSELPNYSEVVPALLEVGIDGLAERCKLTPGIPLKPMLARPMKAIGEVLDRFENKKFTCEYKYDGERAQVHMREDGKIFVYSRNSEDTSKKYPDLIEQLPRCISEKTKSFVFDAEAVAMDRDTGKLLPFQELSRRKRKNVKIEDIQVRVKLFAFDLLYLNGEPLLHVPLAERRDKLKEHFKVVPGEFDFATASDGETTEEIQAFLELSIKDGCEGLMVKMLHSEASHYEPSRRSVNWLKVRLELTVCSMLILYQLKKDYLAGVGDSLDLVVVGAYHGAGKRTSVYGAFLLACYDAESEEWQTICKVGTGFSDVDLAEHYKTLHPLEIAACRGDIKAGGAKPDVWFEPKVVWEVLTADLSLSPIYTAAQGVIDQRGISLRFPRFIRIRDDKDADDATGPEQTWINARKDCGNVPAAEPGAKQRWETAGRR
ncbi:DNA ligase I [Auriculariales sp. MPI-PUGE-AT-0066]|nr:DNA ligase I [Auriculariales sp. MPI-PUGE-AT-0066]